MVIVYKATFPNGKCYIGITNNFDKRKYDHKRASINGRSCTLFYQAIRKYGFDTIIWEILSLHETRLEALIEENRLIKESEPNYNLYLTDLENLPQKRIIIKSAQHKKIGKRASEAARMKMKISQKRRHRPNNRTNNDIFLERFNNGTLSRGVEKKLAIIKNIYQKGMSLDKLAEISGICRNTIGTFQWKWLDEYVPAKNKRVPMSETGKKSIKLHRDRRYRKITRERFFVLMSLSTKDTGCRKLSTVTGIPANAILSYHRGWEDFIEEEGF